MLDCGLSALHSPLTSLSGRFLPLGRRCCCPTLVGLFFGCAWHYTDRMLWVKSLHIVFVASWFAGLFYLPRIFVNLAMVPPESEAERTRLLLMARKLMRFMNLLLWPAVGLGVVLWAHYGIGWGPGQGWMHAKLAVVVLAIGYHHVCASMLRQWEARAVTRSHVWFRVFNEIPVVLMVLAVCLVVVKPPELGEFFLAIGAGLGVLIALTVGILKLRGR